MTVTAIADPPPPNREWEKVLPIWALIEMNKRRPDWRRVFEGAEIGWEGVATSYPEFIVVNLTDEPGRSRLLLHP